MATQSQNPNPGPAATLFDRALGMLANGKYFQAQALVGCAIVDAIRELVDVVRELAPAAATEPAELPPGWRLRPLED
jgi:hypothetical protein